MCDEGVGTLKQASFMLDSEIQLSLKREKVPNLTQITPAAVQWLQLGVSKNRMLRVEIEKGLELNSK